MKKDHENVKRKYLKLLAWISFTAYLLCVVYVTFMNREPEPERMAWTTLFGSYRRTLEESHEFIFWGLIDNILMMIPLGFLFPCVKRRNSARLTLTVSFCISFLIEIIQYLTRLGYFDIDDIFNNLWGTAIGYGLFICADELAKAILEEKGISIRRFLLGLAPLTVAVIFFIGLLAVIQPSF